MRNMTIVLSTVGILLIGLLVAVLMIMNHDKPIISISETTITTDSMDNIDYVVDTENYRVNYSYDEKSQITTQVIVADLSITNHVDATAFKIKLLEEYDGVSYTIYPSPVMNGLSSLCSIKNDVSQDETITCTLAFQYFGEGNFTLQVYEDATSEWIDWQNLVYEQRFQVTSEDSIILK